MLSGLKTSFVSLSQYDSFNTFYGFVRFKGEDLRFKVCLCNAGGKRDEIQGEWRPQAGGGNFSET